MNLSGNFTKKFGKNFTQNESLSKYNWFNLGGNAEFFFKPNDKNQLIDFIREAKKINLKTTILGAGSNTLVRDKGVKGAVIKLGPNFSYTKLIKNNIIEVGAATLDRKVANFANSISKNSKTQVIIVKTELELIKYFKRNLTSNEIIIGMGAGSISKWMIGLKSSL